MLFPYGGSLINGIRSEILPEELNSVSASIPISKSDLIQAINIATGAFSPLDGFMNEAEYRSVLETNKLPSGLDWPLPVLLRVDEKLLEGVTQGEKVQLTTPNGQLAGVLDFEGAFEIDAEEFAHKVFGTTDNEHVGVALAIRQQGMAIAGSIQISSSVLPHTPHFHPPSVIRSKILSNNWTTPVAFSTRNVQHLGHRFQQARAKNDGDGLGIFVITGADKPGNFRSDVVLKCYQKLCDAGSFEMNVFVAELRLPPLYAGPREAVLQGIMLQNYGFLKFIVGRDHAGVGNYYDQYASQETFEDYSCLEIGILKYEEPFQCFSCGNFSNFRQCHTCGLDCHSFNGRDIRKYLLNNNLEKLTHFFAPEVLSYLQSYAGQEKENLFKFSSLFIGEN